MRMAYQQRNFRLSLTLIEEMNLIAGGYMVQGYRLTVRQLYYQLVTRNLIANEEQEYD